MSECPYIYLCYPGNRDLAGEWCLSGKTKCCPYLRGGVKQREEAAKPIRDVLDGKVNPRLDKLLDIHNSSRSRTE